MGNAMHQYALFGTAQFKYDQTITHISDQHRQIVICNNGSDVRYATLEEWEEAGALFDERAQIEASSPARAQHAINSSSFAVSLPGAKMFTLMDIAERTGALAIRLLVLMSGSQEFAPKQPIKELNV